MQSIRLDHVAIAVQNLDLIKRIYTDLGLDMERSIEEVSEQNVKVLMSPVIGPTNLEFLESTNQEGPITKFIQKKGEGLHHLCFKVANIDEIQQRLEKKGYHFIYAKAKVGAHNCLINFLHPKCSAGVLIELSQNC